MRMRYLQKMHIDGAPLSLSTQTKSRSPSPPYYHRPYQGNSETRRNMKQRRRAMMTTNAIAVLLLLHGCLLLRFAVGLPGGIRSLEQTLETLSAASSHTECVGRTGSAVVVTTRDIASRYSSEWDIQRRGSYRIRSEEDLDLVRLCIHLQGRSQISQLQLLESHGGLQIETIKEGTSKANNRHLREEVMDWT